MEKTQLLQLQADLTRKKELNNFYNEKETEYQQRKKELENILAQIQYQNVFLEK